MKMSFNSHAKKTRFHRKGFALSLVLKVRVFGSRKWPVGHLRYIKIQDDSVSKNKLNETIIHRGGGGERWLFIERRGKYSPLATSTSV